MKLFITYQKCFCHLFLLCDAMIPNTRSKTSRGQLLALQIHTCDIQIASVDYSQNTIFSRPILEKSLFFYMSMRYIHAVIYTAQCLIITYIHTIDQIKADPGPLPSCRETLCGSTTLQHSVGFLVSVVISVNHLADALVPSKKWLLTRKDPKSVVISPYL